MSRPAAPADVWAGLHVLVDDDPRWPNDPVAQARAACAGGAHVVQLRAKHATDREALAWAREIAALAHRSGARFVVNDRFDLALAADADAVHLGQDDLPPTAIPQAARDRLAVGRSTHTLEQALAALDEPIDYLALGPIYGTTSKDSEYDQRGLALLAEVVKRMAPRPVVAIGGISLARVVDVIEAGARGIAVISAVAAAAEPASAVSVLCREIARAGGPSEREASRPTLDQAGIE